MTVTLDFLREVYGSKKLNGWLLVWQLRSKLSNWFQSIESAAEFASGRDDTYFGLGLSPTERGSHLRCKADEVLTVPGIWIDVDFQSPAHKHESLPPDIQSVVSLIKDMPPPTVSVNSGFGLHVYWLFEEPLSFADAAERKKFAQLVVGWQGWVQAKGKQKNWKVDSTADLARVLRLPGTFNCKIENSKVEAKIVKSGGPRYTFAELEGWLGKHSDELATMFPVASSEPDSTIRPARPHTTASEWGKILDGVGEGERNTTAAKLIGAELASMRDLHDAKSVIRKWEFIKLWNANNRPPMPHDELRRTFESILRLERRKQQRGDSEFSDAVMHAPAAPPPITNAAAVDANAERTVGRDAEPERPTGEARATRKTKTPTPAPTPAGETVDRQRTVDHLRQTLDIPLLEVLIRGSENPSFYVAVEDSDGLPLEIRVGPSADFLSQDKFRAALYGAILHSIPIFAKPLWVEITNRLGVIARRVHVSEDTRSAQLREWMRSYLEAYPPAAVKHQDEEEFTKKELEDKIRSAFKDSQPYWDDGNLYVNPHDMLKHIAVHYKSEAPTLKDLKYRLSEIGWTGKSYVRRYPKPSTLKREYWTGPLEGENNQPAVQAAMASEE